MHVTYLGHAAILVEADGKRILMDPWLTDPTYHGSWWHYPALRIGVRDLPRIDYLYVSHEHPDHFDPPTLAQLDRNIQVVIANFRRKRFHDRIRAIGFENITELEFGVDFKCPATSLTLRLIPPDRPWDDSAILLRDGRTTVLNVNDCHLDEATLMSLGENHDIDLAFLTFTGASQYPGCFDFGLATKLARCHASKTAHLDEFVNWARLLKAKRAVPAAGNHALLAEDQLFLNTPAYANTPGEAVAALEKALPDVEVLQMNPGDEWSPKEGLKRLEPAPDWSRRMDHIEAMSRQMRGRIVEYFASEPAPSADLYDRFHEYFDDLLGRDLDTTARIGISTWWQVTGPNGGDWTIDFGRKKGWVRRGIPDQWNLRLTIPDKLVYLGVSEQAIWDNVVLSFRLRLARQPDRYMREFWTWFSKV
jgi:UDP-MurNAc hydroxylase